MHTTDSSAPSPSSALSPDSPGTLRRDHFFATMEEFGFFDSVQDTLPPEFTLVYDIARLLDTPDHPITKKFFGVLYRNEPHKPKQQKVRPPVPVFTASEEYQAHLISSVRDVQRLYPHQYLLPDEIFYQKLAERSLWMPRAVEPRHYKFDKDSNEFEPDHRKQKVYVLLDTSSSMIAHHRMHLAKAIVYIFLKRNMKELGTVYFRTFDLKVGELSLARDKRSFRELIFDVMNISALGNGTVMSKALLTAVQDIRKDMMIGGSENAEILLITDGAVHVDKQIIADALGDTITLNTIKIGSDTITPPKTYISDSIRQGKTDQTKYAHSLLKRKEELRREMSKTKNDARRHTLQTQLDSVHEQFTIAEGKLMQRAAQEYGKEIRELSTVFVEIPDINPYEVFSLSDHRIHELTALAETMEQILTEHPHADDVKKVALLVDHLQFVQPYNKTSQEQIESAVDKLRGAIRQVMGTNDDEKYNAQFNSMDNKRISALLHGGTGHKKSSWGVLVKYLVKRLLRRGRIIIQIIRYRSRTIRRAVRRQRYIR
jgi:hypothetical protein